MQEMQPSVEHDDVLRYPGASVVPMSRCDADIPSLTILDPNDLQVTHNDDERSWYSKVLAPDLH